MTEIFHALRPAWIVAHREVRDQFRDWRIIFPVLGLTVFFPFLMNFTAGQIFSFVQEYGAVIIGERMIPFLLMIVGFFPISVSLVIALETFVGEKERGSIEPLLNSPLKDWQLYLGKLVSATVPPLVSSFLGMLVYLVGLTYSHIPWPEAPMLLQIVCLTVVQAVVMVSGAVVVSCQATSVRAANLLASFIIIPAALLIQGESLLMFWGNYESLWWAVFGLLVLSVLLVRVGLAHFQREELLGREIDVLNFKWIWGVFRQSFCGGARSPWEWYRTTLRQTLRGLGLPVGIVTLLAVAGVPIGMAQVEQFPFLIDPELFKNIGSGLDSLSAVWPLLSAQPLLGVWWQNARVLLLAWVLGAFSFGVFGVLPLMATMAVTGYLMNVLAINGAPVVPLVLGLILPHGIFEIPAAILATAAVLQSGAVLATPTPDRTVGEVWLTSFAGWAKIMVGIVIPLLLLAAGIEIWVTPRVAVLFFH